MSRKMTLEALELADHLPATFTAPGLTEEEFLDLCARFPDAMVEYTSEGTVIIMPSTDPETSARSANIIWRLRNWAESGRRGIVTGPDGGFLLPDGSRRSPDAAWFSADRWREAKQPRKRFPIFAPEFVIELRSPDDKIKTLREKMHEYIANGVALAWLIDPIERAVTIYRPGRPPEVLRNPASILGEGPVEGFALNLDGIL